MMEFRSSSPEFRHDVEILAQSSVPLGQNGNANSSFCASVQIRSLPGSWAAWCRLLFEGDRHIAVCMVLNLELYTFFT